MLFGYTNPDILSRHQNEIKDEYYKVGYTVPWLQKMENFQETKEKFGEYPKVNKTVIPDEFKDFTINERLRRAYPAPLGRAGVGSIPANPDAQNVPSFRRWRFEMKLSPFFFIDFIMDVKIIIICGTV